MTKEVLVDGMDGLKTFDSFESANFSSKLQPLFHGFKEPTEIQKYCWYILKKLKRDLVGVAETGSGKTLAFALPILHRLFKSKDDEESKGKDEKKLKKSLLGTFSSNQNNSKIKMLILAPTRELALQIHNVISSVIPSLCIYGGVGKDDQIRKLKQNILLVTGTPGRILDLANEGHLILSNVKYLVLDEADRMLDLGFSQEVQAIIDMLPPKGSRSTTMFSATWPLDIQKMASKYLEDDYIKITVGSCANKRIEQNIHVIDESEKNGKLLELLSKYSRRHQKIIIFALYKKEASRLEFFLKKNKYQSCDSLHGDKPQLDRQKVIENFKSGSLDILVATDVASRGLDIPLVHCIINYTFPLTIEDYVHRIGRTGRAGNSGISHTFFTTTDKLHAGELVNFLIKSGIETIPEKLKAFGMVVKKKQHKDYGAHYRELDPNAKSSHTKFSDSE